MNELDLEIKKLEAEKLRAEISKAELEGIKLRNDYSNTFLKYEGYIKLLSSIILGIPLIFLMYNNFAKPLAELELKRSELTNIKEQISIMKQMNFLADSIEKIHTKTLMAQLAYEKKIDDLINIQDSLTQINPSEKNKNLSKTLENKKRELSLNNNKSFLMIKSKIEGVDNIKHSYVYFNTFQNLLDYLYLNYINQKVDPYTYGNSWVLQSNKVEIKKSGETDNRSLKEVGIFPGATLELLMK